jgi:hypothetical protein
MVGIDNIKKLALLGAEATNVGIKVMGGGGLFPLLSLIDEVNAVKGIKIEELRAEVADLTKEEREEILTLLKDKIELSDKKLEDKIESELSVVDEAIDLGFMAVGLVKSVQALVQKAESIIKA